MKDAFQMWRDTRMVVLTALIAATYAAVMIPFKGLIIIPGFTELRPAVVIPVVFSLMFGPAAAWGAGMGNVIGDVIGGQFGPGSFFGFVGNFLLGYIPYKVWGRMGALSSGSEPTMRSARQIVEYILTAGLASAACATFIGWGLDMVGLVPFVFLSNSIFVQNIVLSGPLGPPLLAALYPRVRKWRLLYKAPGLGRPPRGQWLYVLLLFAGTASGYVIGNAFYLGVSRRIAGGLGPALGTLPSLTIVFLSLILLDLRETRGRLPRTTAKKADVAGEEACVLPSGERERFLRVSELRFTYRDSKRPALDGIGFSLEKGEHLYVMGKSEAGKSSLCLSLRGLIPECYEGLYSGDIVVNGKSIAGKRVRELAGEIGIVFQDFESQLFCSTVELELAFTAQNLGVPRQEIEKRVARYLELVGLSGFENRNPATLSGGEKQRLALGAVLAGEPQLLILDEITSDLDPAGREDLLKVIGSLNGDRRMIVAATHAYEEARRDDSIMVLREGKVAAHGLATEILCQPRLMESNGVRPRAINVLAEEAGLPPLAPEENAMQLFTQLKARLRASWFDGILREEQERSKRYGQAIIEVEGLTFSLPEGKEIISGLDLRIREGEMVAIVGKNGAGKTTLVKHFNGLLFPTRGEVRVKGTSTKASSPFELCKTVGFVFQNPDHQIFSETVAKEVSFGPRNFGVAESEMEERVCGALSAVRLTGFEEADPFGLPKGGRQKVAVASALAMRPRVLVLDEPTTGLDYEETIALMDLVRELNEGGHTVVLVTHSMWVVARYAHRVVVMDGGRILVDTTPRALFADRSLLEKAGLTAPEIATLTREFLGKTLLSEKELQSCLGRR